MMELISQSFLFHGQPGNKVVVAFQRHFIFQLHARHHGVYALIMELGEAHAQRFQEQVARVLRVVKIIGVVNDTLYVALVVADFHFCLKNIFHHFKFFG